MIQMWFLKLFILKSRNQLAGPKSMEDEGTWTHMAACIALGSEEETVLLNDSWETVGGRKPEKEI